MRILLLSETALRLEGGAGPLSIEAESPAMSYSPFHMVASGLAACVYSVLASWAERAGLSFQDLQVEVGWEFVEAPHRVGRYQVRLRWTSLPESRWAAAERAAHLCPVHQTLQGRPDIETRLEAA